MLHALQKRGVVVECLAELHQELAAGFLLGILLSAFSDVGRGTVWRHHRMPKWRQWRRTTAARTEQGIVCSPTSSAVVSNLMVPWMTLWELRLSGSY